MANQYYKTPPPTTLKPVGVRTFVKSKVRKSGVVGIVRDGYGKKAEWFSLCKEVKARDNYRCVFCSAKEDAASGVFHHVHHLVPLSRGGTTTRSNLATTCEGCHSKRPGHSHMKTHSNSRKN